MVSPNPGVHEGFDRIANCILSGRMKEALFHLAKYGQIQLDLEKLLFWQI